ncbi:hypothetical protein P3S68_000475 [Capsicum galapagoense]
MDRTRFDGACLRSSRNYICHRLPRSERLKENAADRNGVGSGSAKKGKRKLWISLSKGEIEEDVYSMTRSRPTRRPKKRSKTVQKQLDILRGLRNTRGKLRLLRTAAFMPQLDCRRFAHRFLHEAEVRDLTFILKGKLSRLV